MTIGGLWCSAVSLLLGAYFLLVYRGLSRVSSYTAWTHFERLQSNQWLSREALEGIRWAKIRELLAYAVKAIPFYRELWKGAGVDPRRFTDVTNLRDLPVVTRDALIAAQAQDGFLLSRRRDYQLTHSSGTTGPRVYLPFTRDDMQVKYAGYLREFYATDWRLGVPSAAIHYSGHPEFGGRYSGEPDRDNFAVIRRLVFRIAHRRILLSPYATPRSGDDSVVGEWYRGLRRRQPFLLETMDFALLALWHYIEDRHLPRLRVPRMIVLATLASDLKRRLEDAFETEIFNRYGPHEMEGVAYACHEHRGMHMAIDSVHTEFLDAAHKPVGPGDFVSDPMAVRLCGAVPVFADIDASTLNLDPRQLERHISPRTRVIMPTDYAGLPADIHAIRRMLGDRAVKIVRDAAHSFGSHSSGRPVGVWAGEDATCFSFDPIKNLTCGEGGAVLVSCDRLADSLRRKKALGFQAGARTRTPGSVGRIRGVVELGYRYHMSDLNAAIGLVQFRRFPQIAEGKRRVARHYDALLANCNRVGTFQRHYGEVVPFIYPIRVPSSHRDGLIQCFSDHGIHADLRYPPCHQDPLFAQAQCELPVTEWVAGEHVCLPIYADLEAGDIEEIVALMQTFLADADTRAIGRDVPTTPRHS